MKILLSFIAVQIFAYLFASFCLMSFDIFTPIVVHASPAERAMLGAIWIYVSVVGALLLIAAWESD